MTRALPILLALFAIFLAVGPADAASVLSPRNGEAVSSKPVFTFDFARGAADVEVSRVPDVRTSGDSIGSFVDQAASDFFLIGGDNSDGPTYTFEPVFPERLHAGRYFWHARLEDRADGDEAGNGPPVTWGPTKTFTVRDEPAILEGYTLRAQQLKRKTKACKSIVRLRGKVAFSDNQESPEVTLTLKLQTPGNTMRIKAKLNEFSTTFDEMACIRRSSFRVTALIRDSGNHVTSGASRQVRGSR